MPTKTDRELLAAWRETGDESAFAELVARHRQMVYRTSLRMLGNIHDTEDAVQAVFVVLAQKADRLQREGSLGGWLHTVTRHVAMQALARRASHARREKEFAMWPEADSETSSPDVDTSAVLRCLDQELAGLSAVLRQAVVLRYLQGNSEKAAAELAGCPLGTLSRRASQGIAKLRLRLSRRGVALSGVALASLLTSEASAAVPETLLPSILAAVKTAAATSAAATTATSTAAMLAKGAMKAMFIAKVKMVAAVAAASLVVAGGGAIVAQEVAAQRKAAEQPVVAEKAQPKPDATMSLANDDARQVETLRRELEALWSDLYGDEPAAANAVLKFYKKTDAVVPFLMEKLQPLKLEADQCRQLLKDLGSADDKVWKVARDRLDYLDPRLAIDLATLMDQVTDAPTRTRMVEICSQRPADSLAGKNVILRRFSGDDYFNFYDGQGSFGAEHRIERIGKWENKRAWTRAARGVAILEQIGTAEAVKVLQQLASGHPDALPTKCAKESLTRLKK